MAITRGGLVPARIGKMGGGSPFVDCMFNPAEYSISKSNNYSPGNDVGKTTARQQFQQGQPRSLTLKLYFDTYQDGPDAEPVTKYTNTLFYLMSAEAGDNQHEPPDLEFKWGPFTFKGRITQLKVNYTLFGTDGTPLRATADITMNEIPNQTVANETAARSWEGQTVRKTADSSITDVAAQFTSDPSSWRLIAEFNGIDDPLNIPNGITLKVPSFAASASASASLNASASFDASASFSASANLSASASASAFAGASASASASANLNASASFSASASFPPPPPPPSASFSASVSVSTPRRP